MTEASIELPYSNSHVPNHDTMSSIKTFFFSFSFVYFHNMKVRTQKQYLRTLCMKYV